MSDFSKNKDGKLAELQVSLEKLRKELSKHSTAIKPMQQKLREAKLEVEQCSGDLSSAEENLEEIDVALKASREELERMKSEQRQIKVSLNSEIAQGTRLQATGRARYCSGTAR